MLHRWSRKLNNRPLAFPADWALRLAPEPIPRGNIPGPQSQRLNRANNPDSSLSDTLRVSKTEPRHFYCLPLALLLNVSKDIRLNIFNQSSYPRANTFG